MVLDGYVGGWLNRVETLEGFLENGVTLRTAPDKRQEQDGNKRPKVTPLSERRSHAQNLSARARC